MDQGRGPGLVLLLLAACGGGSDGGGAPDGYDEVFAEDFSAFAPEQWQLVSTCIVNTSVGRPAPALTGDCTAVANDQVHFEQQHAIAAMDFETLTGGGGATLALHTFTPGGDALIRLNVGSSDAGDVLEVDCPESDIVLVGGFTAGFHHVDLRVDDRGTIVMIDGVQRCTGSSRTQLRGEYQAQVGVTNNAFADNLKVYRQ